MTTNAVPAKLSWPRIPNALPRERLFQLLDELRTHPLIWIGGPPGSGKTTLIASYVSARALPGVRYAIDCDDGDPERFCRTLSLAQNCCTVRLEARRSDSTAFGRDFIRELYERMPRPGVLVLDDCHVLSHSAQLHALLLDLAEDIPSGVNVILIGRGEPPSVYTRLTANGTMAALDSRELRFTADETCAAASEFSADQRVLEALHNQCKGWAAGIALALQRLRRQTMGAPLIEQHVREAAFDYFAAEVFDRATVEERRVLVATALLPRVSARTAAELTGTAHAATLLQHLARRQLFTVKIAGASPEYEYEPLFRDFLLTRVDETVPMKARNEIITRAGAILEQRGELEASAALLARTENWPSLLQLLCRHGISLLAQGNFTRLQRWIALVPAPVQSADPWYAYWSAAASVADAPAAARPRLECAWTRFKERADRLGQVLTAASMLETYRFEWSSFESAVVWLERLEACVASSFTFPSSETALRVYANMLHTSVWVEPSSKQVALCIARLKPLMDSHLDINQRLFAGRSLLMAYGSRLDIESAQGLAKRLRSLLSEPDCSPAAKLATLHAVAYGLWLGCSYAESEACLREALTVAREHRLGSQDPLHHQIRHWLALGRSIRAEIAECGQFTRQVIDSTSHLGLALLSLTAAAQSLKDGELTAAADHCARAAARADEACARPMQWLSGLLLSGCRAMREDFQGAAKALQQARAQMEGVAAGAWQRDYELLAAYIALRRADRIECHRLLASALITAQDSGTASQAFALLPAAMGELCMEALKAGIAAEAVRGLIRRYRLAPPASADRDWPWDFKVWVLGRFRIQKGDAEIHFSRRIQKKTLELLQALIALGGTEVGAGVLTDALWPDSDGDAGYHALESALYRLRQLLGAPAAVTMAGSKLTLDRRYFWIDMWAFEKELQTSALRRCDLAARLARIRQLYQGHFLAHESDKPWALRTRQALRDKFVRSIRETARSCEAQGLWEQAANVYQAGIELDGLAEDLYRGLMLCHRELGDHSEALQVYRRCRELMVRVLGVPPNAKTLAIYNSVRQSQTAELS